MNSPPYTGGFQIGPPYYLDAFSLVVPIKSTTWGVLYLYQCYAGRTLIGVSKTPASRRINCILKPSLWPQHLTVLAVDPLNRNTDYGSWLPPRPYNVARLPFTVPDHASWADAKYVEVTAGTEPSGAVDSSNVIARDLYRGAGNYTVDTEPLAGSGTWNFELTGRDNKPPDGNLGTADTIQATGVLAHPPDVALNSDGTRLTASVESQTLTVGFAYQS